MNYIDIIPRELIELILYDITSPYDLISVSNLNTVSQVINNNRFWDAKIRKEFPDVNFALIPSYLYKLESESLAINLANYSHLYQSYKEVKDTINFFQNSSQIGNVLTQPRSSFKLSSVNNIAAIIPPYADPNTRTKLLDNFINGLHFELSSTISFYRDQRIGYIIQISYHNVRERYNYTVDINIIFDLLLHIYCNGVGRTPLF